MEWLAEYGYIGLFFGAMLAATIIPLSSDILLVGLLAAGGDPYLAVVSATLGNWLGGISSYWLGWIGKWSWIEKLFKITQEKLESQREKIERYGSLLAFLTWLPLVGDLMAIGLGFYRIDFKKCAIFMLIGKGTRFVIWALLYHWFGPAFFE